MKILYIGKSLYSEKDKRGVIDEYLPYKETGFFMRNLILKPAVKLGINSVFELFFTSWIKKASDYDQIIIGENAYIKNIDLPTLKKARQLAPEAKIIYWFRNTYSDIEMRKKIEEVKKYTSDIFTFDKKQSEKFGIKYNSQNFPTKILDTIKINDNEFDLSIVASLKDRGYLYSEIIEWAKKNDLNFFAAIVIKRFDKFPNCFPILKPYIRRDFMPKEEYDSILSKSKVIIDFYQSGQEGETFRVLEATILKKKIITNNTELKSLPIYNSDNFFFFGENDISMLRDFIETPYNEQNGDNVSYYELKNWLRRFDLNV